MEVQSKFEKMGESSLQSFSMENQDYTVYNFEGEDYRKKQILEPEVVFEPTRERRAKRSVVKEVYLYTVFFIKSIKYTLSFKYILK